MSESNVNTGDWIYVGNSKIPAYVINVVSSSKVSAGYYQNGFKAIKENFLWNGKEWEFETAGVSGAYLRGDLEAVVKRGPLSGYHE